MVRSVRICSFLLATVAVFAWPGVTRAQGKAVRDGVPPISAQKAAGSDGSGAYRTGHYRDLFAEEGHSAKQSRAKIDAAFQQLFHGDKNTQALYYEVGAMRMGRLPILLTLLIGTLAQKVCLME